MPESSEKTNGLLELGKLFAVAESAVLRLAASKPQPTSLYHFTDTTGLVGILTTKNLWATLAMSLNDASEIQFGVDRVEEFVQEIFNKKPKTMAYSFIKNSISDWRKGTDDVDPWPYVVSFCTKADSSFHWLHYGRSGAGVAVEFDPAQLEAIGYRPVRVCYEPNEQRTLVRAVVGAVENVIEARRGREDREIHVEFITSIMLPSLLWTMTPFMKDPAFKHEEEWRLVSPVSVRNSDRVPLFRTTGGRVVPYVTLGNGTIDRAIKAIVLGAQVPMVTKPLDAGLAVLLRQSFGDRHVPVSRSKVPVRP